MARLLADALAKTLGQSVVVENKPGGGTAIGTRLAAQAAPGDVLVGEAALTSAGAVRFERVGPIALRGVAQQVTVYRAYAN